MSVAVEVCAVTLSPVAVTVMVYVPAELPVMLHVFWDCWPELIWPMLCVVESLVVRPLGSEMLTCALETESPLAETVATSVAESFALIASSEFNESVRLPAANACGIIKTNAIAAAKRNLISAPS